MKVTDSAVVLGCDARGRVNGEVTIVGAHESGSAPAEQQGTAALVTTASQAKACALVRSHGRCTLAMAGGVA